VADTELVISDRTFADLPVHDPPRRFHRLTELCDTVTQVGAGSGTSSSPDSADRNRRSNADSPSG
jgi:hypothetical protein